MLGSISSHPQELLFATNDHDSAATFAPYKGDDVFKSNDTCAVLEIFHATKAGIQATIFNLALKPMGRVILSPKWG